jgi:hypothetical protein
MTPKWPLPFRCCNSHLAHACYCQIILSRAPQSGGRSDRRSSDSDAMQSTHRHLPHVEGDNALMHLISYTLIRLLCVIYLLNESSELAHPLQKSKCNEVSCLFQNEQCYL